MRANTLRSRGGWLGSALLLLPLPLPLGCTNVGGTDDGFDFSTESNGPGISGSSGSGSGTADEGSTGEATGSTGSDTGPADEGSSSSGELPPAEPCTSIDIVFVVDDSEPMAEEQARMQTAALAFVQQLAVSIPTLDAPMHVGVITTDDELFVPPGGEGCEAPYEGGNPWMLSSSSMLATELSCALSVGVMGSPNERPMDMLIGSLADENLQPGGPHFGFLREDALLVVVLVTNEEDELEDDTAWGSAGDPPAWVEAMAGRKGGWVNDVVVLSLLGTPKPNACPDFQWDGTEGAQVSPRLIEFTESFPQGAVGDICQPEYDSFLLGVVPGVTAACAGYIPP